MERSWVPMTDPVLSWSLLPSVSSPYGTSGADKSGFPINPGAGQTSFHSDEPTPYSVQCVSQKEIERERADRLAFQWNRYFQTPSRQETTYRTISKNVLLISNAG